MNIQPIGVIDKVDNYNNNKKIPFAAKKFITYYDDKPERVKYFVKKMPLWRKILKIFKTEKPNSTSGLTNVQGTLELLGNVLSPRIAPNELVIPKVEHILVPILGKKLTVEELAPSNISRAEGFFKNMLETELEFEPEI